MKKSRDPQATRARILEAATTHFSTAGYDGTGLREIAAAADVDPALIIRYHGSKEGLFREVAARAFGAEEFVDGDLVRNAVETLTGELDAAFWTAANPLRLLLHAIGSPVARPILAEHLQQDFIEPLSRALQGPNPQERGTMLAAVIIGFALLRVLPEPGTAPDHGTLKELLEATLKASALPPSAGSP